MTSTDSPTMQAARAAIEQGQRNQARRLLRTVLQAEPENYRAWLWLAGLTESPTASLEYVRRAHSLQPEDATVAKALTWAEQRADVPATNDEASPPRLVAGAGAVAPFVPRETPLRPNAAPPAPAAAAPPPPAADTLPPRNWKRILALLLIIIVAVIVLILVIRWARRAAQAAELPTPAVTVAQAARFTTGAGVPGRQPTARLANPNLSHTLMADTVYVTWRQAEMGTIAETATQADITPNEALAPIEAGAATDPNARWIDVNLTTQTLVAYENDTPVYDTLISSGMWPYLTVTGQFHIYLRLASQNMSGYHLGYDYYLPDVPYVMYFYQDYALHGAYWHHSFGTPMSHGCVNLDLDTAAWLYDFASVGTLVKVHY